MTVEILNDYSYIDENREVILELYNKIKANLVPIPKGRGKKLGDGWAKYQIEQCTDSITNDLDFAVMSGETSNGLAFLDLELRDVTDKKRESTLLPIIKGIFGNNCLNKTIVVKTGNGYHVYFRNTGKQLKSKDFTKKGITIEIKGQGKYVIGASSRHYDKDVNDNQYLSGKIYEIISNTTNVLEIKGEVFINILLKKKWNPSGDSKNVSELYTELSQKGEGSNRQGDLLRILSSLKLKNPEFDINDLKFHAYRINKQFKTSYPKKTVDEKVIVSWNFANNILQKKSDTILESDKLFSKIFNEKPDEEKIISNAHAIVTLCIKNGYIVVKSEIRKKLSVWCKKHNVNPGSSPDVNRSVKSVVDEIFSDNKKFLDIKKICYELGISQKPIVFDQDQIAECGEWVKGRLGVKRIELNGEMIFFNEMYYERNADEIIERYSSEALVKHTNNSVKEVIGYIERTSQLIKSSDISRDVHLKCLLNGIYNIETGVFTDSFNPDYIILNQIPHNYNELKFPQIKKRVSQIIVDEKDRQTYFDFASTCLHPYTGIDFQFGLVGIAGTGKTMLGHLLDTTFGVDNVSHSSIHDIATDPTIQQDIAYGFLNYDEELSSADIKFINVLKKWITQGMFSGRSIYQHKAEFRPTARMMFMTNSIFEISNSDDALAIYERTYLAKTTTKFRGKSGEIKDIWKNIDEKEVEGFITYLLKNATEIFKNQTIQYPQKTEHTERLWNEYGNNIHKFIEKWIEKGTELKNPSAEIFSKWIGFALDNKVDSKTKKQFYEKFDDIIGSSSIKIREGITEYYGYLGIKLRTIDEKDVQERIDQTPKGSVLKLIGKRDDSDPIFKELRRLLA
jgi:phage/plasmid-associated DNA primase